MDTIDIQRDPCAEAIARGAIAIPAGDQLEGAGERDGQAAGSWTPGRERPIRYVQHPSYQRFLRPRPLAS
jgi:hypothetical protein